ncbi:uncharacterized protein ASPGLDRAFT_1500018 [Aspergillus glaucus CBS 516.65]|uniref:Uncharacterized protein n=1 Tax=Aspergillus glaucus CBS 516.65 TaxID=1160497 RepID=A0A1L9VXS0_ASPGL|nr:hypothetical protein ASPGLDRAFT_1500018 [Aspergillus glaucus CBS 516.65]OJJ88723.1 hypothetical protein ASPGLDRAFT_1500018 [Aspergillus glaucus CBS 516.65]
MTNLSAPGTVPQSWLSLYFLTTLLAYFMLQLCINILLVNQTLSIFYRKYPFML